MPRTATAALIVLLASILPGLASCATSETPVTVGTSYSTEKAMPMDANRKVAEQDCTKPIDVDRGNLRCK